MRILLNYSSGGRFAHSQLLNCQTGLAAGFNVVYRMTDADIDSDFAKKNEGILKHQKGAGYWLWKPYFINRLIGRLAEDDVLFYCDSGAHFIKPMDPILEAVQKDSRGVVGFNMSGGHIEKEYTKRDVFRALGAETPECTDTPQRTASFMAFRGTPFAKTFVRDYLNLCCDPHLITDEPNSDGWVEPGFRDNRHDQSIWSVLTKKNKITMLPDPSQWGLVHKETTEADMYINHTRDPR